MALIATDSTISAQQRLHRLAGVVVRNNGKMDASCFNLNPKRCITGAKLAKIEGSVCHGCYDNRIIKMRKNVADARDGNHAGRDNVSRQAWIASMVWQILYWQRLKRARQEPGADYHRWFAGGDCQSYAMAEDIVEVAKLTPNTKHWVVTKEFRFFKGIVLPENMCLRVSAPYVDQSPVSVPRGTNTCTVHKEKPAVGYICPSSETKRTTKCSEYNCTACWNRGIDNISYKYH